ncbi:MAG TPA: arylamine N-acetyltransferase [Candidatus Sulfotelmatobacter sp.]|nr:arylamine N-acetyltransferase [Candidatus Sulfotelmatobacter sp.]
MLDVPAYLARIAYSGPIDPTPGTLRALHRAHLLAVPFENLDISLGRKIVADEGLILNKIISLRRGGFCYELNCAFAALLRALGFHVTLLSARVARTDGGEGPEFDHLTLRVDLEEPWLADVGFGDSFLEPLRLEPEREQSDPVGIFRLIQDAERWYMQRRAVDSNWKPQYSFSLQPRKMEDFAGMCHHHQTSPDSSFTRKRICSRATPDGRITLSEMKLMTTRSGQKQERVLTSEDEWIAILYEQFGVAL